MRIRMRSAVLIAIVLAISAAPLIGTSLPRASLFRCSWSGTMNEADDFEGTITLTLGAGHGGCGLPGMGQQLLIGLEGSGFTNLFQELRLDVRFSIKVSGEPVRSFTQKWLGIGKRFVVLGSAAGFGQVDGLRRTYMPHSYEPFDVPVTIAWTFLALPATD